MNQAIFITVCCLVFAVPAQDDVDKKLMDLFGTPKPPVIGERPPANNTQKCECVLYHLCQHTNRVENECPDYLEVCCNPENITRHKGCGYRNPDGGDGLDFAITGDSSSEAHFGEFPWMVAILTEEIPSSINRTINVYKCGGALIHPQVVLTAAHCVPNATQNKYKIRAGEWDTQTTQELYPHQDRSVSSVVIHNKYDPGVFNDVALLFLGSPLNITTTVDTLCLPSQDIVIPSGTKCVASSWGKSNFGKGPYQSILSKIGLPIVDRNICQDQLRTTRLGKRFDLDKSFVCAGGERGKDTCRVDSGSPLVCPIPGQKDRFQHVGMVAWSIDCGKTQIPDVYVNIPMFRNWIDQQVASKNLELTYYQY